MSRRRVKNVAILMATPYGDALYVGLEVTDEMPQDIKDGLARRHPALKHGSCPCGGRLELKPIGNRAARRASATPRGLDSCRPAVMIIVEHIPASPPTKCSCLGLKHGYEAAMRENPKIKNWSSPFASRDRRPEGRRRLPGRPRWQMGRLGDDD